MWDPLSWIRSHVRVPSIGTSFRTVAFLQAMLLPASKNSKPWYPDVAVSLRPVLPAHFSQAMLTG